MIERFLEESFSVIFLSIVTGHGTFDLIAYFCEHSSLTTIAQLTTAIDVNDIISINGNGAATNASIDTWYTSMKMCYEWMHFVLDKSELCSHCSTWRFKSFYLSIIITCRRHLRSFSFICKKNSLISPIEWLFDKGRHYRRAISWW